eukprot:c13211_g1_i3.p1 GENE.c13211_g1_i3~~c13211_g1_i3.p1  ORF type:complete len:119 (+),score=11.23 c13211_g1_i3:158-514(+)
MTCSIENSQLYLIAALAGFHAPLKTSQWPTILSKRSPANQIATQGGDKRLPIFFVLNRIQNKNSVAIPTSRHRIWNGENHRNTVPKTEHQQFDLLSEWLRPTGYGSGLSVLKAGEIVT